MKSGKESCTFCAWRENCRKKFSISGRDIRCPEFVRDLNIKECKAPEDKPKKEGR